jgi:putative ABC transport system permease protein
VVIYYKTFIRLAGEGANNSKEWSDFYHYIKLKDPLEVSGFQDQLNEFGLRHFGNGEISGATEKFSLQPLSEIHLDDTLEYEYANVTNGKFLTILIIIGLLILVIAWINYINLTSGRVFYRSKEVGVRRVLGAHKRQIIFQFIIECVLVNLAGLILAVFIILVAHTYLERFISIPLSLSVFWEFKILNIPFLFYFLPILFTAVLAVGLIPSILQSKIDSGLIFKSKSADLPRWGFLRKSLLVFQFGIVHK